METLDLRLKLKSIPVKLEGQSYTLKELTGEQRDIYLASFEMEVEVVDKKPRIKTGAGFKSFSAVKFLAMSLYNENNEPVKEEVIAKWPASTISKLHKASQSLSGLDEEAEDNAKND